MSIESFQFFFFFIPKIIIFYSQPNSRTKKKLTTTKFVHISSGNEKQKIEKKAYWTVLFEISSPNRMCRIKWARDALLNIYASAQLKQFYFLLSISIQKNKQDSLHTHVSYPSIHQWRMHGNPAITQIHNVFL